MRSSLATTRDDLARTLRLSLLVTPRRDPLLDFVDQAIGACRVERNLASSPERSNDFAEALDKLFDARALVTGERQ